MKRKKICFPALLFLFGITSLFAQDRSFATLPLAQKPNAIRSAEMYGKETPQYQKVLSVYNRLVQARGDFRYPVPALALLKEVKQMAAMDYSKLEIILEERAYQVCSSFGNQSDAALALLLAHELTHYYEKHGWRKGFVEDNIDLDIGLRLDSLTDNAAKETEADYLGGFLVYSAGYGLFDKGPEVLAKLYQAYEMPVEKSDKYPSLSDRQSMGRRSAEKLAQLVEVFDMANLLTAIGNYTDAYAFYYQVLMVYQSREIYNNLGVTAVLDAMQYFSPADLKYRFPIELDLTSTATRDVSLAPNRDSLLRQALLHFDAAISMDPQYAPAYLNKACAYALLKDYNRARFYAGVEAHQAALKNNYPKTALGADVLNGILDALEGEEGRAQTTFKAAASAGSPLAAQNLRILLGERIETEIGAQGAPDKPERIDEKVLARVAEEGKVDDSKTIALAKQLYFYQNPLQGPHSRLFVSENSYTKKTTYLHLTSAGYAGKTARQIGLGDDRTAIVAVYGEPGHTIETPRGEIMVYKKNKKMIFLLNPSGKLERWGNYLVQEQ
ncbi:MAG: tetratricopeptide repeat protein [Saprospiraceae bacterium]|nr:tetratricopeptide repeat protein [Saprospiraceae bacterium]MDZ4702570.1 tetratricopeptide repeat protein [Saprospiraceae bacterium]